MEQSKLKNLTPQQAERFARLERLFGQPGWKDVEAWAKNNAQEQLMRAAHANTWDQNRIAMGARLAYLTLVQLVEQTHAEFEALADQNAEKEVAADELEHE